jgi:type IV pilus assembly protein PilB
MLRRVPIGEVLLREGRIDEAQLRKALSYQRQWGGRLGHVLITLGFVDEAALLAAVSRHLSVPLVEIGDRRVPPAVVRLVPQKLLRERHAFPIAVFYQARQATLLVAFSEPQNLAFLDEIAFASGMAVKAALAAEADIERALARHFGEVGQPIELPAPKRGERMELVERPRTPRDVH